MGQNAIPTKERLARALEAENDPKLVDIIRLARAGHYDDYESDIATPTLALVMDLRKAGHWTFAARVQDGEFDGTKAEAEAWFAREGRKLVGAHLLAPQAKKKKRPGV